MQVKLIKPVLKKPTANTMLNNKNDWIPSWFRETKKKNQKNKTYINWEGRNKTGCVQRDD
jgi:hypothetical protein